MSIAITPGSVVAPRSLRVDIYKWPPRTAMWRAPAPVPSSTTWAWKPNGSFRPSGSSASTDCAATVKSNATRDVFSTELPIFSYSHRTMRILRRPAIRTGACSQIVARKLEPARHSQTALSAQSRDGNWAGRFHLAPDPAPYLVRLGDQRRFVHGEHFAVAHHEGAIDHHAFDVGRLTI